MWLKHEDTNALQNINRIQAMGAAQMLGLTDLEQWERSGDKADINAIVECGLSPGVSVQVQGVLRFYRIAKTREDNSMLGAMWEIVEADRKTFGITEGINWEVARLLEKYKDEEWPIFENKEGWKTVIDKIAREEANEWYCEEMNASGLLSKKDRYRRIREAEADVLRPSSEIEKTIEMLTGSDRLRYEHIQRAHYLDIKPTLAEWEVREIALMRLHDSAHVRVHNVKLQTREGEVCASASAPQRELR